MQCKNCYFYIIIIIIIIIIFIIINFFCVSAPKHVLNLEKRFFQFDVSQ